MLDALINGLAGAGVGSLLNSSPNCEYAATDGAGSQEGEEEETWNFPTHVPVSKHLKFLCSDYETFKDCHKIKMAESDLKKLLANMTSVWH